MGSLVRKRLFFLVNSATRNHKPVVKRSQHRVAVNSTTESSQLSNDVVPVFKQATQFGDKPALHDMHGDYTYRGIFLSARQFANELTKLLGGTQQERVAFLLPNDASYVIVQWACWISGQIAVPLSDQHPASVLDYYINDADARVVVTTLEHLPLMESLLANSKKRLVVFEDTLRLLAMKADGKMANNRLFEHEFENSPEAGVKGDFYNNSDAMFIYTSGTTSKPKGVVLSHKNLQAQINALVSAWKYDSKDIILHALPLNHVHGVMNLLLCPMYVGARCIMLPKFETSSVWSQLLAVNLQNSERSNVFMAVPTIYMKLIHEYDQLFSKQPKIKEYIYTVCSTKIRLMVSGSAPLPKPIFDRWEEITGHRLLERYGMTETGMVLTNPLEGERIPGTVGNPFPSVEVRITKPESQGGNDTSVLVYGTSKKTHVVTKSQEPISGDLQVKGDSVFKKYWNKPDVTAKSFTSDGWFKTGDTAQYENGVYKILGRTSVDIIKTGGYKVSALEVETALLGHSDIIDCAVVGVPDTTWGQKVAAIIVLRPGTEVILSQLRTFGKKSLPEYAVPTILKVVDKIPKNSMGKVNKPDILKTFFVENQK
ncbi:malonate--CoA ligase ACSF3, mitochondrial isoform X1 [Belonocnema kinseyi]|uniref:malonate--CoA ligase ACSF3, mitochondrial isoform X1 n=1 Tax=Belonocnema kinseyi TaxID=2817044 RepID=UPI00143CDE2B|nr:malonate--CoA ligase ACSF3, mitochondrial isoform X1 [Belonocnema kinseyi]